MTIHGFTMLAMGLALFYVRATMTNLFFYVIGGAFSLLLVTASLLFIAGVDWICAAGLGWQQVRRLRGLLFLSTATAASTVVLILYPRATIQMLCYIIAVYTLLLSLGKLGLARAWSGTRRERGVIYLMAGVSLGFSAALFAVAGRDDREALAVVGGYSLFMGFQMLLTMHFLQQQTPRVIDPASELNHASL
jgi:hypothetical protein